MHASSRALKLFSHYFIGFFCRSPIFWKSDIDVIVPITKEDRDKIEKLGEFGYKLPKIVDVKKFDASAR